MTVSGAAALAGAATLAGATCCEEAPRYAANPATIPATTTNVGIVAHFLRPVIKSIRRVGSRWPITL
jgi:hypothetical protein